MIPRIGLRAGRPFVHRVSIGADSAAPITLRGLPPGLTFDSKSRVLAGRTRAIGSHRIEVLAGGAPDGVASFELVVGDAICLTPPLGWNSWNAFGPTITEDDVRSTATALIDTGLADAGWTYVNIDDGWQGERDRSGRLQPNGKFGDLAVLCADLHAIGLRVGIYSSPGPLTCGGYPGSAGHEAEDARSFASWGFDYLKYDWCSAGPHDPEAPLDGLVAPYATMRRALDRVDRDVVYHLCQYGLGDVWRWGRERVGANAWRTTGDIEDTWASVDGIGFGQEPLADFAGPGGWNDPDMLVLGSLGGAWNRPIARTRLTADEEQSHLTLWVLLAAPLLLGCDVPALPEPTLARLRNQEMLTIHQDAAGRQARRALAAGSVEVWRKPLFDGSAALGVFNRGGTPTAAGFDWADLGWPSIRRARDVWARLDLDEAQGWQRDLPGHGSAFLRVWP